MKNLIVPNPTHAEIRYVLMNLSDKSREDVFGALDFPPEFLARYLRDTAKTGDAFNWVFYHDGRPAALLGARRSHGGVWSLYGMGTDDWRKVWRLVTLVAKRDMMQSVLDAGAHRAQCVSPASHKDTHKWLRYLGATNEVEMPKYGKDGEDYVMFYWLREENDVL